MKKNTIFWIFGQIRRRIPAILLMTLMQVGHALFSVFFALGTRGVVDAAVSGDGVAFRNACIHQAVIIGVILLCLTLMRHLKERLRADLERDWKRKLLHGLLHGEYAAVSDYHSAELLNRLNNDVTRVNEGVLNIVPGAAAMVTRLFAAVVVLGTMDGRFAGLVVLAGAVVIGATALMRRRLKRLDKQVSALNGKVSGFIQESIEKLLMVQAMDVSGEVERRADDLLQQRYEVQRRRKNVSLLTNTGISLMSYGAGFLALVWCAGRMLQGKMSFGSLMAVIQLVNQIQSPVVGLSGVMPQYIAMIASAERLMELEQIQGEPEPVEQSPQELYARMETLVAEHLDFSYDLDQVLRDATFELPKGSFTAITGPSGVGKSTLLKLLLGVYRPERGRLYLRGGEGEMLLDRRTRGLFAYVPQGNLLLSGTLRENLTIVCPQATQEQLRQALHVSCLEEVVNQLPRGLDTVLGESGAGLSEGQAQRLAIARAILGGAPILLLDECTSALDAQTEQQVLERIRQLPDKTCIAVTHRPAAAQLCDWQLQLREGKMISVRNVK
jgi:ATP-binding cassette subfamily B protein